jgi:hypothetical protein
VLSKRPISQYTWKLALTRH